MSIERDDLRIATHHRASDPLEPLPRASDEDLAALGYVKVTEGCETCCGRGKSPLYPKPDPNCPDCGGSGKKLRDGVVSAFKDQTHIVRFTKAVSGGTFVVIPAEWLEATE